MNSVPSMRKRRCPDDGINLSVDLWTPTVGVGEEEDRHCSSGHSSSGSSSGEDMSFSLWEMEGSAKDCHHVSLYPLFLACLWMN